MSRIRTNLITNRMANGAPTVSHGLVVAGVTTITGSINNLNLTGITTSVQHQATNVNVTGVVTATTFYGSGANLTGIDATKIITGNTQVQTIDTGSDGHVKITTEGSERARITSAGKFLIGTSTPQGNANADDLVVSTSGHSGITIRSGTSSNGNIFFADGTSGGDEYRGVIDYNHSSNHMSFSTNAVERIRILSNGNVLIGTSVDGNQALNVYGAANAAVAIQNSNTGTGANNGLYIGNGNGTISYIWNYENDSMRFATNNTERMRITSNGNILIGNSNGGSEAINMVGGGGGILISRSTSSSPNDGQTLGDIGLNSYSASQTCSSADVLIRGQADGDHSGSSAGSALLLFTTPASTGPGASATERLRINKSGAIGIAGANYGSAGQVLTSNGSGSAVSWAAAGGIGMAQHWRLTSSSQGNQTPLTSWEAADNSFAGSLGSSMSVSSGVFTYPSTGIYFVIYTLVGYSDSSTQNLIGSIQQSIDGGSNWGNAAYGLNGIYDYSNSYPSWGNTATHYIFDITDTSQQKTRFIYGAGQGPEYAKGDTNITYTGVTFIRLGDT